MEQWWFVLSAFGLTVVVLSGYAFVLRSRLRAAESELRALQAADNPDQLTPGPGNPAEPDAPVHSSP